MEDQLVKQLSARADHLVSVLDVAPVVGDVIAGRATAAVYHRFLRGTYQYVRASGHLLALTAAGLRLRDRHLSLAELLTAKSGEEGAHDRWALADLAACGGDVDAALCAPVPRAVRAYVSWSEAMAEDGSPAYLGAAYMLEGIACRRAGMAARRLRGAACIPHVAEALTFLEEHGEADVGHVATLERALRGIDDDDDRAAILLAADVLASLYPRFFAGAGGDAP
ncbi:MAG TPA: iron-containing redox enzyme family protein [Polyangia bacterium]